RPTGGGRRTRRRRCRRRGPLGRFAQANPPGFLNQGPLLLVGAALRLGAALEAADAGHDAVAAAVAGVHVAPLVVGAAAARVEGEEDVEQARDAGVVARVAHALAAARAGEDGHVRRR